MEKHVCFEQARLNSLDNKTNNLMELVKDTNAKVVKIYEYIFEGGMEKKYATKEEVEQAKELQDEKDKSMVEKITSHDKIFNKLVWIVITGVIVFIGTSVIGLIKK